MDIKNNMTLWNSVCKTNPKNTKPGNIGGKKITSVCAQSQRKKATEILGIYGIDWGIVPDSEILTYFDHEDITLCCYQSTFFFNYNGKSGKFPIGATIKLKYKTQTASLFAKIYQNFLDSLRGLSLA